MCERLTCENYPLISVIVPVYNTEPYLKRCLQSIEKQTYTNIEVIIIDDGSTDKTLEIARMFAEKDQRFRFFYQKRQGVSAARNLGLEKIRGQFLVFVDGDDRIVREHIMTLWKTMKERKADMTVCDYRQECWQTGELEMKHYTAHPGRYSKKAYIRALSKCPGAHYFGVLWNKIYQTNLIKDKGLIFDRRLSIGEDFSFNMDYLSLIHRVQVIPDQLYFYSWCSPLSLSHCKKTIEGQMEERLVLYQAYEALFRREKLERRWRYRLHYYLLKAHCEELKALGSDGEKYRKEFDKKYIRDQGIGKVEFQLFYLLKKIKALMK